MKYSYQPPINYIVAVNPVDRSSFTHMSTNQSWMFKIKEDNLLMVFEARLDLYSLTGLWYDKIEQWFLSRYDWLKKNAQDEYSFDKNGFHFEQENDMILFRIAFP